MPEWTCTAGNTLLIPSGRQGYHFYIILTNPFDYEGYPPQSCISVCICTIRKGPYDKTCIIDAAAHPFIGSDSYVAYRHARFDPAATVEQHIQSGLFIKKEPIGTKTLEKIITGLKESPQTPNYLKELI